MARKARDYRAEYARRIASAQARGLSRTQARGHPRASEPSASEIKAQMRVMQLLHDRGELSKGAPGYEYARQTVDGPTAPYGSDLFHARALELARLLDAEVRYAYSVLLGSP